MTKTALRALAAAALMATAGFAHAACDVTVEAGDNMKYNTKEIAVDKSCKTGAPEDVKPNDERIVAHAKMLGGGEEDTITVDMSKVKTDGDYSFFCSFPGHSSVMKGKLKFS